MRHTIFTGMKKWLGLAIPEPAPDPDEHRRENDDADRVDGLEDLRRDRSCGVVTRPEREREAVLVERDPERNGDRKDDDERNRPTPAFGRLRFGLGFRFYGMHRFNDLRFEQLLRFRDQHTVFENALFLRFLRFLFPLEEQGRSYRYGNEEDKRRKEQRQRKKVSAEGRQIIYEDLCSYRTGNPPRVIF